MKILTNNGNNSKIKLWNNPELSENKIRLSIYDDNNSGLVGAWHMNEGTGTTIADVSGNGNTGTFGAGTAAPTWVNNQGAKCLRFDGVDDYISYSNNIAFDNKDFSISAWINMAGIAGGAQKYNFIFSQRVDEIGSGKPTVNLFVLDTNKVTFQIRDNVGAVVAGSGDKILDYNEWYYITFVKNSSNGTIYVNGIFDKETSHSLSGDFDAGAVHRFIGKHRYSGTDYSFFNGTIDEVRIYNYALTQGEITNLFKIGKLTHQ